MLIVRSSSPMLPLLYIHDLLYRFKIGLRNQRIFNDLHPNDILSGAGNLPAVRLPAVDTGVLTGTRQVSFLVDDSPPGPDWISEDQMHPPRRHADNLGEL